MLHAALPIETQAPDIVDSVGKLILPPEGNSVLSMWTSIQRWFLGMRDSNPVLLDTLILESAATDVLKSKGHHSKAAASDDADVESVRCKLSGCVISCSEPPADFLRPLRLWVPHMDDVAGQPCHWQSMLPHDLTFDPPTDIGRHVGPNPLLDSVALNTVLMRMPSTSALDFLNSIVGKHKHNLSPSFWKCCVNVIQQHSFPVEPTTQTLLDALVDVQSRGGAFSDILPYTVLLAVAFQCPKYVETRCTWMWMKKLAEQVPQKWTGAVTQLLCSQLAR